MKYLKTFESLHNDVAQFAVSQLAKNDQKHPESNFTKDDLDQLKKKDVNRMTEIDIKKPVKQMIKRFRKKPFKKKEKLDIPTNQDS